MPCFTLTCWKTRSRPGSAPRCGSSSNSGGGGAMNETDLLQILKARFDQNPQRHGGVEWAEVARRRAAAGAGRKGLRAMEGPGGEHDVVGRDEQGRILFCDCSVERPKGRRSLCYDREALDARKEHQPQSSVVEEA